MLTLEMLYAVLQGLPSSYLTRLDEPLAYFCGRIHAALNDGHDPITALQIACVLQDRMRSKISKRFSCRRSQ